MEKRDWRSDYRGGPLRPWSGIFGDRLIVSVLIGSVLLFILSALLVRKLGIESEMAALCGCGGLACIGVVFLAIIGKLLTGKLDTHSFWTVAIFIGMLCGGVVIMSKSPMIIGIFLFVAALLAATVMRLKSLERSMTKRFSWRVSRMLEELKASAAEENGDGSGGKSPWDGLFEVVSSGNLTRLEELLAADPEAVYRKDRRGNTLLHSASVCGYADVVSRLIEAGAPVNERNDAGRTPLHCASLSVSTDEEALCRLAGHLLDHGGDIAATDRDGATALSQAERRREKTLADYLRKKSRGS